LFNKGVAVNDVGLVYQVLYLEWWNHMLTEP